MPLGPYLDAAAAARRFSDRMCAQWGIHCPHLAEVANELVAAAVLQRNGNLRLSLAYEEGVVRMQLLDGRAEQRTRGTARETTASEAVSALSTLAGRIVNTYTSAWGPGSPGSCELFWAELPASGHATPEAASGG